jgi:hypothetical protein
MQMATRFFEYFWRGYLHMHRDPNPFKSRFSSSWYGRARRNPASILSKLSSSALTIGIGNVKLLLNYSTLPCAIV